MALGGVTSTWAQDQDATMTPEERLKRMQAIDGRMPKDVVTSFKRRTVDSTQMPWRAIGRINYAGRSHCTGTLIAEDIVLTAAHCIYSKSAQARIVPSNLHFVAGYSKGDYLAHSTVKSYILPDSFNLETAASNQDQWQYDWALLVLVKPVGETVGFLKLHPNLLPDAQEIRGPLLQTPKVTAAGYAGDRAHILSLEENCSIRGLLSRSLVMLTDCQAVSGDSGGPILQEVDGSHVIVGITTVARDHARKRTSIGVSALAFRGQLQGLLSAGR